MVENKDVAMLLKELHSHFVNEVETQNANSFSSLDTVKLYECFLNALCDTQGKYCSDDNKAIRIPRPVVNPAKLLEDN